MHTSSKVHPQRYIFKGPSSKVHLQRCILKGTASQYLQRYILEGTPSKVLPQSIVEGTPSKVNPQRNMLVCLFICWMLACYTRYVMPRQAADEERFNQHTMELISAKYTQHKYSNKDLSRLEERFGIEIPSSCGPALQASLSDTLPPNAATTAWLRHCKGAPYLHASVHAPTPELRSCVKVEVAILAPRP